MGSKEAVDKAKNGRFAIVTVWRNIRPDPIESFPLAVCDARSVVADQDLSKVDIHGVDSSLGVRENYLYFGKYSPNHQWYYYPQMVKDEVLLFKQWDSAGTLVGGSKATFALHT